MTRTVRPIQERLARHTVVRGDCHEWVGAKNHWGYGQVGWLGRTQMAHRVAYELERGPIPAGMQLDHLCRNPACVKVSHLEAVTPRENTLRSSGPAAINARKAHCIRGHELAGDNLMIQKKQRRCRACHREADRRYYARKCGEDRKAA